MLTYVKFHFNLKIIFLGADKALWFHWAPFGVCVILKSTYLWILASAHIGCAVLNYFWGEHGQESNRPTLHALHPEQGVAIVLPPEFNIKHSNEEKVDPHEAVCTCTKRDGELQSFEKIINPTPYNSGYGCKSGLNSPNNPAPLSFTNK